MANILNQRIVAKGSLITPLSLATYIVAEVPDATVHEGGVIYVTDDAGATLKTPAWSDGTNWLRFDDSTALS